MIKISQGKLFLETYTHVVLGDILYENNSFE